MVVGPADELDRLICGLLDLQDDLAQAVMWLAEHWSADLPVAGSARVTGVGSARVDLSAYCRHAELLAPGRGASWVRRWSMTEAPDRRATATGGRLRPFGRVRLEVYRRLDPDSGAAA